MGFFDKIYGWLTFIFGQDMNYLISGYNCETQLFDEPNYFPQIGFWTVVIAVVVALAYYFLFNHPRFNRWWSWLIMLFVNACASMVYGYAFVKSLVNNVDYDISSLDVEPYFLNFGIANAIFCTVCFFLMSLVVKRFSTNCKHSPFKSLFPKH